MARYYRTLSRYSASLAFMADLAMLTLGGKLKRKEHVSGRLGDVLSQLYICSAMLKRFEATGKPAGEQVVLAWAFHDAVFKMQQALSQVIDNFPARGIRGFMNLIVFPIGRRQRPPGDRLTHKVAQTLMVPSETRDRITNGIYTSARAGHPIGVMEEALPAVIAAEPLERKLHKAVKGGEVTGITWEDQLKDALAKQILTAEEAATLVEVREIVLEIISVDEFDSESLRMGTKNTQTTRAVHAA